jgi:hypothetical protein
VRGSSAYGSWQAVGSAFATSASTARPVRALGVNAADQLQVLLRRPRQTGGQPLRRSRRDPAPARATSGRIACGSQLAVPRTATCPAAATCCSAQAPLLAQRHRMRGHPVARLNPATWSPTAATSPAASTPSAIGGRVPRSSPRCGRTRPSCPPRMPARRSRPHPAGAPGAPGSSRSSKEPPNRRTPAALTAGSFRRASASPVSGGDPNAEGLDASGGTAGRIRHTQYSVRRR